MPLPKVEDCYFRVLSEIQRRNVEDFIAAIAEYPYIAKRIYQPNPASARWHWRVELTGPCGGPVTLDFWPHRAKVSLNGMPATQGKEAYDFVIQRALDLEEGRP